MSTVQRALLGALVALAIGPVGTAMAEPLVSSVEPNSGPTAGGTSVTIKGSGFVTGATVTVGGVEATEVFVVPETEITAKTPAAPAGTDEVVVSDINGTSSGGPSYTYVAPPCSATPAIEEQPKAETVTAPAGASFTVTEGAIPAGCLAATIQWQVSTNKGGTWSNVSGATSATLQINPTSTSESENEYRAELSNANVASPIDSSAATLTVEPPPCSASPSIETQPANQTVTAPGGASFTVTEGAIPAGCLAATIQWQVSTNKGGTWSNVSGATSATLQINPTSTSESGYEYRALLTNAAGPTNSSAATLTVNPAPCSAAPLIETGPADQTVVAPGEASFTVTEGAIPAGCLAATIQWQVSTNKGGTWSNVSGATSATLSINPTSTSESGYEYRAELSNANVASPTDSSAATLTVNPAPCSAVPSIEEQPVSKSVIEPNTATFKAAGSTPEHCAVPTVQWYSEAPGETSFSAISGATSVSYTTPATTTVQSGTKFEAVFKNASGATTSSVATLTVEPPPCTTHPVITEQPESKTVTAPASATFEAAASTPANCAAPSVQWYSEAPGAGTFTAIGGATLPSYTTPATSTAQSGTKFEAIFKNASGKTTTAKATLTVNPPPCTIHPAVTEQPKDQTVTAPATATFEAAGSTPVNCAVPSVQWYSEAPGAGTFTAIGGATLPSYTTPATSTAQSGTKFEAIFTNAAGSTESNVATLMVNAPPCSAAPSVTGQPANQMVTAPGEASFTVTEGAIPAHCSAAAIQWQVSTNGVTWSNVSASNASGATSATLSINPTSTLESGDEYRAVLTNAAGPSKSNAATLTVIPQPTVTLESPKSPSNNTMPSFTGSASDITRVTVRIYSGATAKGPVVSTATAKGTGGSWTSGKATAALSSGQYTAIASQENSLGNVGRSTPVTFIVDTTSPTVTLSQPISRSNNTMPSFTGTASDTTPITVRIYEVTKTGRREVSTATAPGTRGSWTSGNANPALPSGRHTYAAKATQQSSLGNPAGTSNQVTFVVDTAAPTVTLSAPALRSNNTTPSFTGTASETSPVTIEIHAGATAAGPLVSKAVATGTGGTWTSGPAAPALPDGQYTAVASQASSYTLEAVGESASLTFTVDTVPPQVNLTYPSNGSSSAGESQLVKGTAGTAAGDLPGVTVQLFSGSAIAAGQTPLQSILVNTGEDTWSATFAGLSPGNYAVRAEQSDDAGNLGVSATTTFALAGSEPGPSVVPVHAPPAASFSWFPTSPHTGETVSLLSSSTDATSPITGFAWNLAGNGVFAALGQATSTSFSTPGSHLVQLRVTDANGLASVASEAIEVSAPVPEVMQPFPIVQISATRGSSGVKLKLLSVQAPAGARITVACTGHGCPVKSQSRVAAAGKVGAAPLAFRRFERSLRTGVILEIRVSKPGEIGKYTRFAVRRGRLPLRVDTCLAPTGVKPMACPSS